MATVVRFNVGGQHFETTIKTLLSGGEGNKLYKLATTETDVPKDAEGRIFIDRPSAPFCVILAALQQGVPQKVSDSHLGQQIANDAEFFGLSLATILEDTAEDDLDKFITMVHYMEELETVAPNACLMRDEGFTRTVKGLFSGAAFCCSVDADIDGVGLAIEETKLGALSIVDPEVLQAFCEPARFGLGSETVMDPAVRTAWQCAGSKVKVTNRRGGKAFPFAAALRTASRQLGFPDKLDAKIHSLNVYQTGGFFKQHVDGEHSPNQVATMVILLPNSAFAGGELEVRHMGQTHRFFTSTAEGTTARCAVFFSDCVHEVKPVTSGTRVTLTYDLCLSETNQDPEEELDRLLCTQDLHGTTRGRQRTTERQDGIALSPEVTTGFCEYIRHRAESGDLPAMLGLLLQHEYTWNSLRPEMLKGADALLYRALAAAFPVEVKAVVVRKTVCESEHTSAMYALSRDDLPPLNKKPRLPKNDSQMAMLRFQLQFARQTGQAEQVQRRLEEAEKAQTKNQVPIVAPFGWFREFYKNGAAHVGNDAGTPNTWYTSSCLVVTLKDQAVPSAASD